MRARTSARGERIQGSQKRRPRMAGRNRRGRVSWLLAACALAAAVAAWPATGDKQVLVIATANMRGQVLACG